MNTKVKVVYIAGTGRNGSTLLGNIFGQIDGFTNVGELLDLGWNLGPQRPPCGCGIPLPDCDMWKSVLKEAFGDHLDPFFTECMYQLRSCESIPNNLTQLATARGTRKLNRRLDATLKLMERLFQAIQKVCGSAVIVDSSKQPMYLHVLRSIDSIDLHVIHLIRDPRTLAYVYLNKVSREGYVLHMDPLQSSVKWVRRNLAIELLTKPLTRRPLRIRYEDFAANPRQTFLKLLTFVGETCPTLPFDNEHAVTLRPLHTVAGNPNRFITGRVHIRERSGEWATQMKPSHKMLVTSVTLPWLVRYGYIDRLHQERLAAASLKSTVLLSSAGSTSIVEASSTDEQILEGDGQGEVKNQRVTKSCA